MAEKKDDGDGEEKKGGKGKLIAIAGLVVVLAAGGFVGMKVFGGSDEEDAEAAAETEPPPEGEVLDVTTLTTNVSGDGTLARVGLAVVTSEGAPSDAVTSKFPLLQDAAVSELVRSDAQVLRTPEGADDLRKRLTRRAKRIYADGEVLRVLITELVVQ